VVYQIETEDVDCEYKRGWILDNIPSSRSQLITIEELHGAVTPEVLFCLKDNDGEGERKTCKHFSVLIFTLNDTTYACLGHEVHLIVMVTGHLLLFIEGRTVLTRMYEQNKEEVDRAVLARLKKDRKLHKTQDNHETL